LDSQETQGRWGWLVYLLGNVQAKKHNYDSAVYYYGKALPLVIAVQVPKDIVDINNGFRLHKLYGNEINPENHLAFIIPSFFQSAGTAT
jgi:hypothetical protein